MTILTKKFSEFTAGGSLEDASSVPGLSGGSNAKFTIPPQFLDQGTTAERPAVPTESMIRYNTDLSLYEFYNGTIWTQFEDSADIALLVARLAAYTVGDGASMIGLEDQGAVSSKTAQDLAEATILAQTDNGTLTNGQFLDDLATGFLSSTTATGVVASRVMTGTANEIDVANGDGSGTPSFSLSATIDAPGTFTVQGTTAVNEIINDATMADATTSNLATASSLKAYIDSVAGGGFTVILTCLLGTTANLTGTYANGTAGVGATLTNNSTQAALTIDGVLTQVNDRILVKDQTSTPDNGVYTVTTVGDGATNWVLTRATDYDEAAEIVAGTLVPVSSGTVNGGSIYLQSAVVTTVGTDSVMFVIFAQPSSTFVTLATTQTVSGAKTFDSEVLASNLSLNGNTISSTDTNGDLNLTPNGTGDLVLDGLKWPQADGTVNQILSTDGSGNTSWVDMGSGGGGGNVGDFVDFGGTSAPSGCLLCDGTSYATATYPDLFAVIGYTWGGSGANFNVPNAERRVMIGSGGTGTATIGNAVGDTGGTETITLGTTNMPGGVPVNASTSAGINVVSNTGAASYVPKSGTPYSGGSSTAVNITQKSMVVLRCIRYEPVATSTATAANQADQETATSSVVFTNPASQQFHPSSAKAWVQYNQSTGPSVVSSYNVTSVTDGGAGLYTVNWGNDFASAAYSTLVSTQGAGAGNSAVTCSIVSASKAAGSALFLTQQLTSALDRDDNCVAAYGELA